MDAPGPFWGYESYELPTTRAGERDWQGWSDAICTAIRKCPNIDNLMKLQKDNAVSIDEYFKVYSAAGKAIFARFTERMTELHQGPIE